MANKGFLLVLMQPPPAFEEEFNAWYDTEHLPERLAVPGFETARRFVCLDGHPRYLAMYDLARPEVLDSPEYLRVAHERSSPWTLRVLARVRVYRSAGEQIHPGDARTGTAARVRVIRFRGVARAAGPDIVAGLRATFEDRPATTGLRVLAYETPAGTMDYLGFVESLSTESVAADRRRFGAGAAAIDLDNTYAPYQ